MKSKQPLYTLVSDNSRWMDSIETAYLKITNPKSGRSIEIKKIKLRQFYNSERDLVHRCYDKAYVRNTSFKFLVTKSQMETLLKLSKQ